jgi:flagellar protein FlaG
MDISSVQRSLSPPVEGAKAELGQPTAALTAAGSVGQNVVKGIDAQQATPPETQPEASRDEVEAAVATIQDFVQSVRRNLNFSLEEASGRVVVKVVDAGSGDLIRQIPSEEALQLAEGLSDVRSLLFKAEA